jgi:hypothetical protein
MQHSISISINIIQLATHADNLMLLWLQTAAG